MSLFGPSRDRDGPDPHLDRKIAIFFIGAAFGVAGMATDNTWLIAIAIAILVVGFLLRFIRPGE